MSTPKDHTKVLIIGAGPAGATAGALLAREGVEVTMLERDYFPRYHIGESLIVSVQETLDVLGCKERIRDHGFLVKSGALLNWGGEKWFFDWAKLNGNNKSSFQVKREEFDNILLEYAKEKGAKVFHGVNIKDLEFNGEQPIAANYTIKHPKTDTQEETTEAKKITFDYLIDCSGRSGILATRYLKSRIWNNAFKNIALWGYWTGIKHHGTHLQNPIVVCSFSEGWMWFIPLHDGTTSVGVVIRQESFTKLRETQTKEQIYHDALNQSPESIDLLSTAKLTTEIKSEGDYSYHSNVVAGKGYYICGDAACFLDPLLSTGCHLAMYSATLASASLLSTFRGEVTEDEALNFYTKAYLQHFIRWVIVVGSFSNLRGKESYFWAAQSLITQDILKNTTNVDVAAVESNIITAKAAQNSAEMMHAFTKMVSGMEDMREVKDKDLLDEFANKLRSKITDTTQQVSIPGVIMNMIDTNIMNAKSEGAPQGDAAPAPAPAAQPAATEGGKKEPHFLDNIVGDLIMVTVPKLGLAKCKKAPLEPNA